MPRLVALAQFDVLSVNLNWYNVYATAADLQNNVNVTVLGHTYPDLYYVQAYDGFDRLELDFYGSGITRDFSGNITSGTVNFIGEFDLARSSVLWYADGLSVSAVALYNTALTSSNSDELGLIQAALAGNDTITLSPFDDRMSGFGGNDTITGGAGHDLLEGGGGNDTFIDTAANMSGDTITDFNVGDKIVFTDANVATFSATLSGHTLSYTGGSLTLTAVPVGHIVLQAAAAGGVQLTISQHTVAGDLNGDGRSDILLRNDTGLLTSWLGNADGTFFSNHVAGSYNVPPEWKIASTGDFNGDGHADILYRNDNGSMTEWLGQGSGQFTWNQAASYPLDPTWSVAATGDFNGDGRSDIVLRNTNGLLTEWLGKADGTFLSNDATATYSLPTAWHVVGAGDFNGDGRSDLVLRNDDGTLTEWLGQSNGSFAWNQAATYSLPTDWKVAGLGDVNGDGRDDLVLFNAANHLVVDWLAEASGTFFSNHVASTSTLPSGWNVAGVGDYNGDGRADLALRNDNGLVTEWLGQANGSFSWNSAAVYNLSTSWHIFS